MRAFLYDGGGDAAFLLCACNLLLHHRPHLVLCEQLRFGVQPARWQAQDSLPSAQGLLIMIAAASPRHRWHGCLVPRLRHISQARRSMMPECCMLICMRIFARRLQLCRHSHFHELTRSNQMGLEQGAVAVIPLARPSNRACG